MANLSNDEHKYFEISATAEYNEKIPVKPIISIDNKMLVLVIPLWSAA